MYHVCFVKQFHLRYRTKCGKSFIFYLYLHLIKNFLKQNFSFLGYIMCNNLEKRIYSIHLLQVF